MAWRIFFFFSLQCAVAALGWWLWGGWGAAVAAWVVGWGVVAWILRRMMQVMRWLRADADPYAAPELRGPWREVVQRICRLQRVKQQQVQGQEQKLQDFLAALHASPNGVLLLDGEGRIEWFNQQSARHFGLDLQRDLWQHIGNLVRDPAFSAYDSAGDYSGEVLLNGREHTANHPVLLSVQLHPYGEGRRLMLSRDVTALQQAEAMRRDFVANVSHEIRTPLTVLAGFIETMQNLQLDENERKHYLGLMAQQSTRMQYLVNDLLTLSRLEGSPLPSMQEWTPVAVLVQRCQQEAQALSQHLIPAHAAPHTLEFPSAQVLQAAGEVAGNFTELYSAFSNLVTNAVRYTPAGGRICVQWLVHDDGSACLQVKDTGPGIAPEHLPRLSERFYRIDRSRSRDSGGTGLGLAIAKHVLQRHGGQLGIASVLGQGSTFSAHLPAQRLRASVSTLSPFAS